MDLMDADHLSSLPISAMAPKMHVADPLILCRWDEWGGWLWFTLIYFGGWTEWIPAYHQIQYQTLSVLQRNPGTLDVMSYILGMMAAVGIMIGMDPQTDWLQMAREQLEYQALSKSDYYYTTIPGYPGA